MKKISSLLTLLILSLSLFTACKEDSPEPETKEARTTRQITAGPFTINTVTVTDADYSFQGPATINFSSNNTFTVSGNDALPNPTSAPNDPFPASGTWAFTDTQNFDEVTLTSNNTNVVLTVTSLDDNNLVFSYQGAEPKPTDAVTVTVTASRD